MNVQKITDFLDKRFPLYLQERYDNAGEQVIFNDEKITGILLSLDLDTKIIEEAIDRNCNLIITHHPFFFKPLKQIKTGNPNSDILLKLIDKRLNLYSAHTNLDKVYFDKIGDRLGIINKELLFRTDSDSAACDYGFGVRGDLPETLSLKDLLDKLKENLHLEFAVYSGANDSQVKRLALINGSGGRLIERILTELDVDCVITGDIGYHHTKAALDYGVPVIDAGHYGTERLLLDFLKEELADFLFDAGYKNNIAVHISAKEQNPFRIYI